LVDARKKRAPTTKASGTRLQPGWTLPEEWRQWALINLSL